MNCIDQNSGEVLAWLLANRFDYERKIITLPVLIHSLASFIFIVGICFSMFLVVAILGFFIVQCIRFLRMFESCRPAQIYHCGSSFITKILGKCPTLTEVYTPPPLWGKCGHIQTFIYGKLGRYDAPWPTGTRKYITLPSKETLTYDIFHPLQSHIDGGDYTILVCPGIANSSEKSYVRTFIQYAIEQGFHVAVLNHIGSLASVKLTAPKIFTYGDTKYFSAMVNEVQISYPNSTFLMVGFSMGGNIALKYLGQDEKHQKKILCCVSLCQGYDAIRSTLPMCQGYRRFYNHMITQNFKKILRPHWNELFTSALVPNKAMSIYDEAQVGSATYLHDIEDGLLRRIDGYQTVEEYKNEASCCHVINKVKIPALLMNTEDDPLIKNDVHDIPISFCESHPQALFASYKFGGHLGGYTGSLLHIDRLTIIEKLTVEYLNAVIELTKSTKQSE